MHTDYIRDSSLLDSASPISYVLHEYVVTLNFKMSIELLYNCI